MNSRERLEFEDAGCLIIHKNEHSNCDHLLKVEHDSDLNV